ncbi:hypothetical protein GCM10007989_14540 [Devosia pacifica]|uniref:Response regulatory domain-containing protein n=1 Tax=Devosia pacifica TaxID=1335967 RepID=A0A918S2C4_9HYPH|nr:response regulator [Devosia pacifica]GHA20544.1 hypothetical protein GCM10007989_14540 [Devosia pacifica]
MLNTTERSVEATILVVDDDALIAMNTVDMLESLGHRVLEAYSGQQALEILAKEQVNAVITDYSMPGMTGIELAHKAREMQPHVAILLATGYSELSEDPDDAFPRLEKPFDERRLVEVIARVLDQPKG